MEVLQGNQTASLPMSVQALRLLPALAPYIWLLVSRTLGKYACKVALKHITMHKEYQFQSQSILLLQIACAHARDKHAHDKNQGEIGMFQMNLSISEFLMKRKGKSCWAS
ncbi:hypothetical protein DUNSADRAFT_5961 [Dunaliella salina]|uniref:Encoded protein n=1 Tax=Dunaliella salina TaxID=3046 RepID=A0ABQ7GP56_DUNSA|nr:hypothetical protein DUNSADRAFT_5961 [Dunaliella salina]|eukprot:KAF5836391.1 hypothetical protein DUNSADRAFT_5961 [Dunaliella salina]